MFEYRVCFTGIGRTGDDATPRMRRYSRRTTIDVFDVIRVKL